jgi:TPR repeat protein
MVGNGVPISACGDELPPGSPHQRGTISGRQSRIARSLRFAFLAVALSFLFIVFDSSALFADYADGVQTQHQPDRTLEDAVHVWRRAAWQQDDYFSQIRLGDLYSQDASFYDPVEAYVWYFMAVRDDHLYYYDSRADYYVSPILQSSYNLALAHEAKVYELLTVDQRLEARERIIYILASRGSEGFLTLGKLHRVDFGGTIPDDGGICWKQVTVYDRVDSPWLLRLWERIAYAFHLSSYLPQGYKTWTNTCPDSSGSAGASASNTNSARLNVAGMGGPIPGPSSVSAGGSSDSQTVYTSPQDNGVGAGNGPAGAGVPGGGYRHGYYDNGGNDSRGYRHGYYDNGGQNYDRQGSYSDQGPSYSVIMASNPEALMYYDIAANLGHPLAAAYASSLLDAMASANYADVNAIKDKAALRARYWLPPFEYYPGSTASGIPHTDESIPNAAQRQALDRLENLMHPRDWELVGWIVEALQFRGYMPDGRGRCRVQQLCLTQAIREFQKALHWDQTGYLSPPQVVRLIQMAAVDGDKVAQNRLGYMYAEGIGVPQNYLRARDWFVRAQNQHYPPAIVNLGMLYEAGPDGISQDLGKANLLYQEALRAGSDRAHCELKDLLAQADSAEHGKSGAARR